MTMAQIIVGGVGVNSDGFTEDETTDDEDEDGEEEAEEEMAGAKSIKVNDVTKGAVVNILREFIQDKTGEELKENQKFNIFDLVKWGEEKMPHRFLSEGTVQVMLASQDIFSRGGDIGEYMCRLMPGIKLLKTSSSKIAHTFYWRLFSGTPCRFLLISCGASPPYFTDKIRKRVFNVSPYY